jgi:hypothetical protein
MTHEIEQSKEQGKYWNEYQIADIVPTKTNISAMAANIAAQVQDGYADVLKAIVSLKAIEEVAKEAQVLCRESAIDAIACYPKSKANVLGADIAPFESYKYDYSHITEWSELEEQIVELKSRQKEIEDTEKKFRRGEIPIKSYTSTIKITLAK